MLDTVRIATSRRLNQDIADTLNAKDCYINSDSGWKFTTTTKPDRRTDNAIRHVDGNHKCSKIHVWGRDNTIETVTVSLPGLLHGFNGYQLKPGEITEAFRELNVLLDVISTADIAVSGFHRVDMVLNIPCDAAAMLAAHRYATHPMIRRETQGYENPNVHRQMQLNTVRLAGKRVVINFYNKVAKHHPDNVPGPVTSTFIRAEVQIKCRKLLRELFGIPDGALFQSIDFVMAYQVYRRIMCQFDVKQCDLPAFGFFPLLAFCEMGGFRFPDGRSALDWYRANVRPETYRKMLKEIRGYHYNLKDFSWAALLPEHGPPATVDLDVSGKLIPVPPPFWDPTASRPTAGGVPLPSRAAR